MNQEDMMTEDKALTEALSMIDGGHLVHHKDCPFFIQSRCRDPHDRCECVQLSAPILARAYREMALRLKAVEAELLNANEDCDKLNGAVELALEHFGEKWPR